ncbi:hypothetical protein B0E42_20240 [Pseudomonas sp. A25(2017)]|nr:hypothetical protein B0E42_20240 [Pseudomonas sp. A25(2017)]
MQDVEAYSTQLLGPLRSEPAAEPVRNRPKSQRKTKARRSSIPPYARNPHRPATVADIETFSARLFDPLKEPTEDANQRAGPARQADVKDGPVQGQAQPQRRRKAGSVRIVVPPYARNPNKVATVADIEAHSRRLFAALQGDKPAQVFKIQTAKPVPTATTRSASTVAASLSRSLEQNQLLPAQRHAIRRVDSQFYELRRFVFADVRLTRQDKAQLFSVLTFERLKAQEAIKQPKSTREVSLMGSASIRQLLTEEESFPDFSISGPGSTTPVRDRIKSLVENFGKEVDQSFKEKIEQLLKVAGLYARKSLFSSNVHYVDQKTDKTLFVDTGNSISLRRSEVSAPAVAFALQVAQQRFGNTLSINGNSEFKKLVVDTAVEKQLPIQYTDSGLNNQVASRLSELDSLKQEQSRVSANFTREFLGSLPAEGPVGRTEVQTGPKTLAFTNNGEPVSLGLRPVDPTVGNDLSATQGQAKETPLPLAFTYQGETASLGLLPVARPADLNVQPGLPKFTLNGEPASLGLRTPLPATRTEGGVDVHQESPEVHHNDQLDLDMDN